MSLAPSSGDSNAPLLDRLEDLESQKLKLEQLVLEQGARKQQATVKEDVLWQLLSEIKEHAANCNLSDIKKFVANYVEKVIVYEEHLELILKLHVPETQKPQPIGCGFDLWRRYVARQNHNSTPDDVEIV
jgi:site-specific DNA recombinase